MCAVQVKRSFGLCSLQLTYLDEENEEVRDSLPCGFRGQTHTEWQKLYLHTDVAKAKSRTNADAFFRLVPLMQTQQEGRLQCCVTPVALGFSSMCRVHISLHGATFLHTQTSLVLPLKHMSVKLTSLNSQVQAKCSAR